MEDLSVVWVQGTAPPIGISAVPGWSTTAPARDLDVDLSRIARDANLLVVLLTDAELAAGLSDDIVERGLRFGLAVVRRPVKPGRSVPAWLSREIASHRQPGPTVYCDTSGHGRAAVAAAWSQLADGADVATSITRVREVAGPSAIHTPVALECVHQFWRELQVPPVDDGWPAPLPSAGLRRSHLPPPRAPWQTHLSRFALSFNGYAHAGTSDSLRLLLERHELGFVRTGCADAELSVDDARACLFGLQRRWYNETWDAAPYASPPYDPGPKADEIRFAWALVEHMRAAVSRP